jgi:ELWxxDGT repeat protein
MARHFSFLRAANDQSQPQLWMSDGTTQGTIQLTDFPNGFSLLSPSNVAGLNKIFFIARSTSGWQLWTDGTAAGT